MNVNVIIDSYYKENGALRSILLTHSRLVAEKAISIANIHSELNINKTFVYDAAMLHDIGIILCNAPEIECHGTEHYMRHGICGAEMLKKGTVEWGMTTKDIEPYARVCERHTGAGITAKDIAEKGMPLPVRNFLPETIEEKLICYADKFYSKTHLTEEKTIESVIRSMRKFGDDTVNRFAELHELFK